MLDGIWFYGVTAALLGMIICAVVDALVDFLTRRDDVRRMAWWRIVTGLDQK